MNTDKSSTHQHTVQGKPTTNTGVHSHTLTATDARIAALEAAMADVVLRITKVEGNLPPPVPPPIEPTGGAIFYIATTGSDSTGTGSIANPWRTITKFVSVPRSPGDTLYCRGGTYTDTDAVLIGNAAVQTGTYVAPIAIRAHPGETPVFVGPSSTSYGSFLFISWGSSFLLVDGLQTTATFDTNEMSVCDIGQTAGRSALVHHVTVRNCVLRGKATGSQSAHGIYVSEYASNITIEDNQIIGPYPAQADNLTGAGIEVYHTPSPTGLLIQRNTITNWSEGIQLWDEAAAPTLTASILNNVFADCHANIDARYHSTLLVQGNTGETADAGAAYNLYDPNNAAFTTASGNVFS